MAISVYNLDVIQKKNVSDGSSFSYPMNLNTLKYRDHEI